MLAFAISVAKVAIVAGFTGVHGLKVIFNIYTAVNSCQFEIMPMDFEPISRIMVQNHNFAQITIMVQNGLLAESQDHDHGPYEF